MMDDKKFEEVLDDLAARHNLPPEVPRQEMWARIDAERAPKRGVLRPAFGRFGRGGGRWLRAVAAAAAVLVIGIAIGRFGLPDGPRQTAETPPAVETAVPEAALQTEEDGANDRFLQLAATHLFAKADFRLTDFRVTACAAGPRTGTTDWAGDMLAQTRLLLGTPAAEDDALGPLLEELELVLAQIAGISASNCSEDRDWIIKGMNRRATMEKLRTAAAVTERKPL